MTVAGQIPVNYEFDDADRLKEISQGAAEVSFSYDDGDRLVAKTLENGVVTEYAYDQASQLTGITYRLGTSVLGNLAYEYDQTGRRTKVSGTYARISLPSELTLAAYNDANQLTQSATANLSYDENGNLTNDGVRTYMWNARNELTSITGSGLNASFGYDAFGRRSVKTVNGATTEFLYDGLNAVQEKVSGAISANLLTSSVDQILSRADVNGTLSPIRVGLGSTLALTDSNGGESTQYTYDPFGQTSVTGIASANSSQYTGRENDGTGLYYYRARYYSPSLQRFISQDPIGFAGGDMNLYAYVGNDPINWRDSYGLDKEQSRAKIKVCFRVAQVPGGATAAYYFDVYHSWIKAENFETGLGPAGGGVPGSPSGYSEIFPLTTMNDHTGQAAAFDSKCVDAEVDKRCIEKMFKIGTEYGRWFPGYNDCNTVTKNAIDACGGSWKRVLQEFWKIKPESMATAQDKWTPASH
jgi:RHS repeat-associated protein